MAKIVNIEWMQLTREFRCPTCSVQALNADGRPARQPCTHLLFSWEGSAEEFMHSSASVESLIENSPNEIGDPIEESFVNALPRSAVLYQIETRDHACGPVVRTDVIGFNPIAA